MSQLDCHEMGLASASKCIQVLQWYPTKSAKKITQQPCATHGLHDFARLQIPVTKRSQCFEQPPKETCFRIDLATWRLGDVKIGQRSEGFSPIFGWCLTARFGLQFSLDLFFFHPVCGNLFQLVAGLCWAYTPKSGSFQLEKWWMMNSGSFLILIEFCRVFTSLRSCRWSKHKTTFFFSGQKI